MIEPIGSGGRISSATGGRRASEDRRARSAPDDRDARQTADSRALVPVSPPSSSASSSDERSRFRPRRGADPAFLAQLMANRADMPHTRVRRRAEPEVADAAYRTGEERSRYQRPGGKLSVAV